MLEILRCNPKQALAWISNIFRWLTVDAIGFWKLCAFLICSILIVGWFKDEIAVRILGVTYQFIGFGCVFINIYRISKEYNLKSPINKIVEWIEKNPFLPKKKIVLGDATCSATMSCSVRGIVVHGKTKGKPVDDRIDIIEGRLQSIEEKFQNFEYDSKDEYAAIRKEIKVEFSNLSYQILDVNKKIEKVETTGLGLTVLGTLLMLFGSLIATFPSEILRCITTRI